MLSGEYAGTSPTTGSMANDSTSVMSRRTRFGTNIAPRIGAIMTTPPTRSAAHRMRNSVSTDCGQREHVRGRAQPSIEGMFWKSVRV